ncbi:MAG: T9SS type A sorting domain-containing protein, partial [Bacteroidetes bacterium]|nr:T9SS type A sorting domain-containing protein [Bacteroidota bacterium]
IEDFSLADGTTSDAGTTAWTSSVSHSKAVFSVSSGQFKVNNTSINGEGIWSSAIVSIAGKTGVQLSVDLRSAVDPGGKLDNDGSNHADYIRLWYKVDGGAEIPFGDFNGSINANSATTTTVISSNAISGSTVQIIIRAKATATDEYYFFDNVKISANGGCTDADIPAGVTAFSTDQVTCYNTSVELLGNSTTPGVSYSWTGPNGFTAATAHTQTSTGGSYTLTVTNPVNGCSKTATAIVQQNTIPPANVTVSNSGPLTCDITSVSISASSADPVVDYAWTGPDGYISFSAEDIVTAPGAYILTATNTANGCFVTDTTYIINNCRAERRMTGASSVSTPPAAFSWKPGPNPFHGSTRLSFSTPVAGFVSIQVYNLNGITEKVLFNGTAAANQSYQLPVSGLAAGIHFVIIRTNDKVFTTRLLAL